MPGTFFVFVKNRMRSYQPHFFYLSKRNGVEPQRKGPRGVPCRPGPPSGTRCYRPLEPHGSRTTGKRNSYSRTGGIPEGGLVPPLVVSRGSRGKTEIPPGVFLWDGKPVSFHAKRNGFAYVKTLFFLPFDISFILRYTIYHRMEGYHGTRTEPTRAIRTQLPGLRHLSVSGGGHHFPAVCLLQWWPGL